MWSLTASAAYSHGKQPRQRGRSLTRPALALLFLGSLMLLSCQSEAPAPQAPAEQRPSSSDQRAQAELAKRALLERLPAEKTLRVGLSHRPRTLDPAQAVDDQSASLLYQCYEGLMSHDAQGHLGPALAERFEVGDAGLSYTFFLRPDLRWSDGVALEASDFRAAWLRAMAEGAASPGMWLLRYGANIKGAQAYRAGTLSADAVGIEVVDARTLRVHLEAPQPELLALTAQPSFFALPRHHLAAHPEDWSAFSKLVCSGPFSPDHIEENVFFFKKNPHYWASADVSIEGLAFVVMENEAARVAAFTEGLLDWTGPTALSAPVLTEARRAQYPVVDYLLFNLKQDLFAIPEVRHAFALALDQGQLAASVGGQPGTSFAPPLPSFRSRLDFPYDPAQALRMLQDGGYADGAALPALRYTFPRGQATALAIAQALQEQLEAHLGVTLVLEAEEPLAFMGRLAAGDFELAHLSHGASSPSPLAFLSLWAADKDQHPWGFTDLLFAQSLAQANAVQARVLRNVYFEEAELRLGALMPAVPLLVRPHLSLLAARVQGADAPHVPLHLLHHFSL